jgi:hypothetical protein
MMDGWMIGKRMKNERILDIKDGWMKMEHDWNLWNGLSLLFVL